MNVQDATKNPESATPNELQLLREENSRLKALLTRHSISWEAEFSTQAETETVKPKTVEPQLSPSEKIDLFRRLFRGRTDVYPVRWKSAKGRSGYSPACGNEWKSGLCNKRQTKCSDCSNRLLLSVTDLVIYDHLAGKSTIGVYPLLEDNSCYFLAADFDKGDWQADSRAFMQSCQELGIPAVQEISRSGNGAHVWIFLHPLDVAFAGTDEDDKPWKQPKAEAGKIGGTLPKSLNLVLANQILLLKNLNFKIIGPAEKTLRQALLQYHHSKQGNWDN